jgi:hypothetical protein
MLPCIYEMLDAGETVCGIYLDVQKAFDLVSHYILMAMLYNYAFVALFMFGLKIT